VCGFNFQFHILVFGIFGILEESIIGGCLSERDESIGHHFFLVVVVEEAGIIERVFPVE
jgi:hypothetical protein